MSSEGTPLHGDRSAWNVITFDTEHGKDIDDSTLRRHLPLPGADGGYARSDGTDWQRVSSLALADLAGYARGYIIRGGASDWEAYDANNSGFILVGDGTDIASVAFDWDTMAGGSGADMVHDHSSAGEGAQISHDSALTNVSADDHHSETHTIVSTGPHAETGLTTGHFLRATGATAFSFAAIAAGDLPTAIDAANIADGSVSNTEFQYLDDYAAIGLKDLASAEVDQLENIASTTISATQWGYLGGLNQTLATTSGPTFTTLNLSGKLTLTLVGTNVTLLRGQDITITNTVTATAARYTQGNYFFAISDVAVDITDTGYVQGVKGLAILKGAGTLDYAYGLVAQVGTYAGTTGTVTNAYGAYLSVRNLGGAITTGYGLYIYDVEATTGYGVYQAGGGDINHFAGKTSIGGTVAPLAQLHVDQSSTTAAIPALYLDQADVSEEIIQVVSTVGVGNAIELIGGKTLTVTEFVKVTINGNTRYIQAGTIA